MENYGLGFGVIGHGNFIVSLYALYLHILSKLCKKPRQFRLKTGRWNPALFGFY